MAKSPEDAVATMIANLKEKTGNTLEGWLKIAAHCVGAASFRRSTIAPGLPTIEQQQPPCKGSKLGSHKALVDHLKAEYGIGHGYANLIAQKRFQGDAPAPAGDDLVAAQYAGAKAALRPIYDALILAVGKFGGDVELAPKKAYVSLRRSKQFGLIQPSSATRVDLGVNLKGLRTDRATGGLGQLQRHGQSPSAAFDAEGRGCTGDRLAPRGVRPSLTRRQSRQRAGPQQQPRPVYTSW